MPSIDPALRQQLFEAGAATWERFRRRRGPHFHPFVPADYPMAYDALRTLRARADSFLELGSGVGVITILADLLGFEAFGIEIDPWLVEQAELLAEEFESNASFVQGSFVPEDFRETLDHGDAEFLTIAEGPPAYDELGQGLEDFDLVYSFPWPDEEALHLDMLSRCGRPDTLFLVYSGTDGYRLQVGGEQRPIA